MKWFFRVIGIVFLLFVGMMTAGFLSSKTLSVERSLEIQAFGDEIYEYLEDLEAAQQWSPWAAEAPDADFIFGGADYGVGANVVWRTPGVTANDAAVINSQEIIAAQPPEFVQTVLLLNGERASATYAVTPTETGSLVYIQFERDLGGFPYLQRLRKGGAAKAMGTDFELALTRLKTIAESH
jgi:hypothetical protein